MRGWLALLIGGLALALRAADLHTILTVDEAYHWFARATAFGTALREGDLAGTNLIGHPGVTTMWLGALGLWLQQWLAGLGVVPPPDLATPVPTWIFLRLPVAATLALGIALIYLLLCRLLDASTALLAGLFLATDPLLVAYGRILHVDGLLTLFMTLTLLLALLAFGYGLQPPLPPQRGYLLAAAVAGGLALLTKSPSVLLFPMVALIGVVGMLPQPFSRAAMVQAMRRALLPLLLWGVGVLLVWFALWPAAWVDLPRAAGRMVNQVRFEGIEPHGWGNYFLGRAVDDPGVLFYPAVLLLRLPPWVLPGIGVLLLARHMVPARQGRSLLLLALFAGGMLLALTLLPKKFDRYALPTLPALLILAAAGWHVGEQWLVVRNNPPIHALQRLPAWLRWGTLALLLVLHTLAYQPYQIAYANPLLGGTRTAAQVLPLGWGEGLEQAAAYLNQQPDGCQQAIATWFDPVLDAFACAPVVRLPAATEPRRVAYAVLYIDQLQRNNAPEATAYVLQSGSPVFTATVQGVPYATVYHLPQPVAQPSGALFGGAIRLQGYTLDRSAWASGVLTVTTQWQAMQPTTTDYSLFVHLLDAAGNRLSQIDVPPAGTARPTSTWQRGHFAYWQHPLPLPADLPAGDYWLAIGLYDPATFARLPVGGAPPLPLAAPPADMGTLLLPLE